MLGGPDSGTRLSCVLCTGDETDDQGRTRRTTRSKDSKRGIPRGSPISPLLSNL